MKHLDSDFVTKSQLEQISQTNTNTRTPTKYESHHQLPISLATDLLIELFLEHHHLLDVVLVLLLEPLFGVGQLAGRVLVLPLQGGGRAELVRVRVLVRAESGQLGRRPPVQQLLLQALVQRARLLEVVLRTRWWAGSEQRETAGRRWKTGDRREETVP